MTYFDAYVCRRVLCMALPVEVLVVLGRWIINAAAAVRGVEETAPLLLVPASLPLVHATALRRSIMTCIRAICVRHLILLRSKVDLDLHVALLVLHLMCP